MCKNKFFCDNDDDIKATIDYDFWKMELIKYSKIEDKICFYHIDLIKIKNSVTIFEI